MGFEIIEGQVLLTDGTNGTVTVKPASTAAVSSDIAVVVAISPNNSVAVTQSTAAALSGAWPVKVTDGTNTMPTMDAVNRKGFQAITDGTNGPVAVKGSGAAAQASDSALVVAISPNNSLTLAGSSTPADTFTNPTTAILSQSFLQVWNGATWDRLHGTSAAGVWTQGAGVSGSAIVGNPVRVGGSDGTNTQSLYVSSTGGVRLDNWLGSTAPTVGSKASASSIPVVIASDQAAVTVAQATATNLKVQATGISTALADATSNTQLILPSNGFNMGFNGTTWDRLKSAPNNADAVAVSTLGVLDSNSFSMGFNGTTWDRIRTSGNASDAVATSSLGVLGSNSFNMVFNGTTWDRQKGTTAGGIWVQGPAATAAATVGNPVLIGGPDASGNMRVPQVAQIAGETTYQLSVASTITSPKAAAAGLAAYPTAYGTLRVSNEPVPLFADHFVTTLDTTNQWQSPITSGAGASITVSGALLTITASTTASAEALISSIPTFQSSALGFIEFGMAAIIEATAVTGQSKFWGFGTAPGSPTVSAALTDAIGFEQSTTGVLSAVVYASGSLIFSTPLTRPSDGGVHKYSLIFRADLITWWVDSSEVPTASTTSFAYPTTDVLPVHFHVVNGASPSGAGTFLVAGVGVGDSAPNASLADGTYPFRKATVKAPGVSAASTDTALVVASSPNSIQNTAYASNGFLGSNAFWSTTTPDQPLVDPSGLLGVRGNITSDDISLYDCFSNAIPTNLTGTCSFTNGSTYVTGSGTSFTTQVNFFSYVKVTGDSETFYARVANVISDTQLTLVSNYGGTTGTGQTGVVSNYKTTTGSGTISVSGSILSLASGTTNANVTGVFTLVDYLPLQFIFAFNSLSQRIANQNFVVGFQNTANATPSGQAVIVFNGTNNTQVILRTSDNSGVTVTNTTVTLPYGVTTASRIIFSILVKQTGVYFYANGILLGTTVSQAPNFYQNMYAVAYWQNTGTPASGTTASLDSFLVRDIEEIQVTATNLDPQLLQVTSTPVSDVTPATQNITAQDVASTNTTVAYGQVFITGTPTAGSIATFVIPNWETGHLLITGTWTGTLVFEVSPDGGVTWIGRRIQIEGVDGFRGSVTANAAGILGLVACTHARVRATAAWTGTATVRLLESVGASVVLNVSSIRPLPSGTPAITQVASSASSIVLKAANVNRLGLSIMNDSTATLYVKFGATASTTSYTVKMTSQQYYEVPFQYTGEIDGIWSAANGFAYVTEMTQ